MKKAVKITTKAVKREERDMRSLARALLRHVLDQRADNKRKGKTSASEQAS